MSMLSDRSPNFAKILYHGTPHPIEAGKLSPRPEYSGDQFVGNLVFATDSEVAAYAYALRDKSDGKWSLIMHSEESPIVVAPYNPCFYGENMDGRVYRFSSAGFRKITGRSYEEDEFVTADEVPLNEFYAIHVTNANQALEKGVQLFLVHGSPEQGEAICNNLKNIKGSQWRAFLNAGMKAGLITHENASRGINPIKLETIEAKYQEAAPPQPLIQLVDLKHGFLNRIGTLLRG